MEGHLSAGDFLPNLPLGVVDPRSFFHSQHQQQIPPPSSVAQTQRDASFPASVGCVSTQRVPEVDHKSSHWIPMISEKGGSSTSDEEGPNLTEEGAVEAHTEGGKPKVNSPWHRVKWTDAMVKLLIMIVSYIGDDGTSECIGGKRKPAMLPKKGKWKTVSKVMAERGFYISPQQCEDKFNDLNKRYKKLNDVLGRGTSCKVVENPDLLDYMDHLSEKKKNNVRKILSSKQLFYEEMCSYHNRNRLFLPADPALQESVQLSLRSGEDHDRRRRDHLRYDHEQEHQGKNGIDDNNDAMDLNGLHCESGTLQGFDKFPEITKSAQNIKDTGFRNAVGSPEFGASRDTSSLVSDMKPVVLNRFHDPLVQRQWLTSVTLQLEEQKLNLEAQALALKRQRFKWQRFSMKKDRELDKLRMENQRMKLENDHMALELKQKELEKGFN